MKCRTLTILLSIVLLLFLVDSVSASITIPETTYFGSSDYGTYINFDETKTFSTIYLTGDTVIIDGYNISSQYSNLTITQFFDDNYLILSVSAPATSTSVITINAANNGYTHKPSVSIYPSAFYSDDFTSSTYTLQITHTSPLVCTIRYQSTLFSSTYSGVVSNAYAALILYSIIPIIIGAFLLLSAIRDNMSTGLMLATIVGITIYAIIIIVTLPIFFSLEGLA